MSVGTADQDQLRHVQGPEPIETAGAHVQTAKWEGRASYPAEGAEPLTHPARSAPRNPGLEAIATNGPGGP